MDFAGCRHCHRAARNRKSGRRERVEQPWQRSEPPEWIDEAMPQDTDTELLKLQYLRDLRALAEWRGGILMLLPL
jgi:hypothetical protein